MSIKNENHEVLAWRSCLRSHRADWILPSKILVLAVLLILAVGHAKAVNQIALIFLMASPSCVWHSAGKPAAHGRKEGGAKDGADDSLLYGESRLHSARWSDAG